MIWDGLSWLFLLAGSFFLLVGGWGILRLPDFYTRLHAASIIDTLGAWCIIIGLMIQGPDLLTAGKLLLVLFFLYFTSPTATHALARAAQRSGLQPKLAGEKPGESNRQEQDA